MLRLLACTSVLLLLAACGSSSSSSSSSSPSPAPTSETAAAGTVAGQPFIVADGFALTLGQATCSFAGTSATATGLALGFGSFSGLCPLLQQNKGLGTQASATVVNLLVVRANVAGGAPGQVQPGTYTISSATPVPDSSGNVVVADGFASRADASCAGTGGKATGGTIRIDAVGARITGSADVTFEDGSHVSGSFDVPACAFQTDVCTAISGFNCGSMTCIP